jgi:hypothetical protein
VCIGWVFFRCQSLGTAVEMLGRMAWPQAGLGMPRPATSLYALAAVVIFAHWATASGFWRRLALRLPAPALGVGYAALLTVALVWAPDSGKAFIYFQF